MSVCLFVVHCFSFHYLLSEMVNKDGYKRDKRAAIKCRFQAKL